MVTRWSCCRCGDAVILHRDVIVDEIWVMHSYGCQWKRFRMKMEFGDRVVVSGGCCKGTVKLHTGQQLWNHCCVSCSWKWQPTFTFLSVIKKKNLCESIAVIIILLECFMPVMRMFIFIPQYICYKKAPTKERSINICWQAFSSVIDRE